MSTTLAQGDYTGPVFDIRVLADDDFTESFTVTEAGVAQNLTGETWTATVKASHHKGAAVLVSFTIDNTQYASGIVTISLTDSQIAALLPTGADRIVYVWSLKRTEGTVTSTWVRGKFVVEAK